MTFVQSSWRFYVCYLFGEGSVKVRRTQHMKVERITREIQGQKLTPHLYERHHLTENIAKVLYIEFPDYFEKNMSVKVVIQSS